MINSCKNSKTIGMELKLCMVSLRRSGAQNVPTELHDCNEEISFLINGCNENRKNTNSQSKK